MKLEFVRFINQKYKNDIKLIGASDYNNSDDMFLTMMRAIVDFTIPKSNCNIFYKNKHGIIKAMQYFKHNDGGFYINGNTFNQREKIFKICKEE